VLWLHVLALFKSSVQTIGLICIRMDDLTKLLERAVVALIKPASTNGPFNVVRISDFRIVEDRNLKVGGSTIPAHDILIAQPIPSTPLSLSHFAPFLSRPLDATGRIDEC